MAMGGAEGLGRVGIRAGGSGVGGRMGLERGKRPIKPGGLGLGRVPGGDGCRGGKRAVGDSEGDKGTAMHRVRDRVGLNLSPLLLRLMLGIIFLHAGLGKVSGTSEVQGEEAATLARLGLIQKPATGTASPAPAAPAAPKPERGSDARPRGYEGARTVLVGRGEPEPKAEDFQKPVRVKNVHRLAAGLYMASHPAAGPDGKRPMALWPLSLGEASWPVSLAWAVAITELGGGLCVLLGIFTRFWAVGLVGVMMGAMWLTQIGPAVQSGKTTLGFLPAHPAYGMDWMLLEFQFALFAAALALVFLGPGRASLDHLLLGGRGDDDDGDE